MKRRDIDAPTRPTCCPKCGGGLKHQPYEAGTWDHPGKREALDCTGCLVWYDVQDAEWRDECGKTFRPEAWADGYTEAEHERALGRLLADVTALVRAGAD